MQKKDVKVGEFYAYARGTWGPAYKVEVMNLTGVVRQGYGYNRRTVNGIMVKWTDGPRAGEEFAVTGRNLRHTWAVEEKIRKVDAERAEAAEKASREVAAIRAGKARRIEDRLAAHGVAARPRSVSGSHARNALDAVGFEFLDVNPDEGRYLSGYDARFDLDEFMRRGRLDEDVVTVLLADSKAVDA